LRPFGSEERRFKYVEFVKKNRGYRKWINMLTTASMINSRYVKEAIAILCKEGNLSISDSELVQYDDSDMEVMQQPDTFNCGPFTIMVRTLSYSSKRY